VTGEDTASRFVEDELRDVQAELTRTRDLYHRMLQAQVRHDRDVYTDARRKAQDDRIAWADHYFRHLIARSAGPVSDLIYRVQQVPDRPSNAQVADLKAAAAAADWTFQLAQKTVEAQPDFGSRVRVEVSRLRGYIRSAGEALHRAAAGRERDGDRCCCAGCELIRGMDDDGAPGNDR
jgi:hypothetical protein